MSVRCFLDPSDPCGTCRACQVKIQTIADVFTHLEARYDPSASHEENERRLSHRVYKDTECGAWARYADPIGESYGSVIFGSIVEGSDFEISTDPVELPCEPQDIDEAIAFVEGEVSAFLASMEKEKKMHNEFRVHLLTDLGKRRAREIAEVFDECLGKIEALVLPGRELAIVRTKLEEACFFAKKSMAGQPGNAYAIGPCAKCGRDDVLLRDDGRLTLHDSPRGAACNFGIEIREGEGR